MQDRCMVTMDHQEETTYAESNGHNGLYLRICAKQMHGYHHVMPKGQTRYSKIFEALYLRICAEQMHGHH